MSEEFNAWNTITPQEEVLAAYLDSRTIYYHRQYEVKRIGLQKSYWLDFALLNFKLAIEIDGHPINLEREAFLIDQGWRLIHLQNEHFATRKIQEKTWESLASLIASYAALYEREER